MKRIILATIILTISSLLSADVIDKTYQFSQPEIVQTGNYQTIGFEGCLLSAPTGHPLMPYQSVALLLPPGHLATSVEIIMNDETELEGEFALFPRQYAHPVSGGGSGTFVKDDTIYGRNAAYPEKSFGELTTQYINGFAVAMCNFTPLKYNPFTGKVSWFKSVVVKLITAENMKAEVALQNLNGSPRIRATLLELIQNPDAVACYPEKENRIETYDLLYITPQAFADDFHQLVGFYFPRGLIGKIATTENIYTSMPGIDNQEKIRNYIIQQYQDHGIRHVVLGGDVEHVPYRGFYCSVQSSSVYEDANIPSDLYYAALDGNWNDDGDNLWGEIGEDDLLPEVGIGRMCFSTENELQVMIDKSTGYQQNPVLGELANPLLVGEYLYNDPETWGSDYLELLTGYHDDNGYKTTGIPEDQDIEKLYASQGSWDKYTLMSLINQGGSFIHHVGHANATYAMKLSMSDITDANFQGINGDDHNYVLIFSHGCICGAFDSNDCIGEKMTTINNLAAAVYMNSRYGWFNEGQTEGPAAHINRELVDAFYNKREPHLGMALTHARIATAPWVNAPGQWEEGALRWNFYDCNLLGDATLRFWADEPISIDAIYTDTITAATTSIQLTITGNENVEGLYCQFMKDSTSYGVAQTDENGQAEIVFSNPLSEAGEALICVSGYNCQLIEFAVAVTENPETHFQWNWTTPFNPMSIFIQEAVIDDVNMQPGDEIGIFDIDPNTGTEICVGGGLLSEELTGGAFLEIVVSMDDGSNPDFANGFTPGNEIIYKLWNPATGEIENVAVTYPYPGYDEVFNPLGDAIVILSGNSAPTMQQHINLQSGWSGISSWLVPENTSMEAVFAEIASQVEVVQNPDGYYNPSQQNGNLTQWDFQSGYLIKMNKNAVLIINGAPPDNNSLTVSAGWNLISVLSDKPVDPENLFSENIDKVTVVKDAVGLYVYWPEQNINTLQALYPGKAYLLKATTGFTVSF